MKQNQIKLRVKTANKNGPTDEPNIQASRQFNITMTNIFRKIKDGII